MNETIQQRLDSILSEIEDTPLREDLFHQFYLINPLEFAKLLHHVELPDSVKSSLLALKVSQKPTYHGENLEPLIERSLQLMWSRLGTEK